jgi:ABC-2 type transport system ATP-binding protein
MTPSILVRDLTKTYRVPERNPGLLAAVRSLLRPHFRDVEAVQKVSFAIQPGEVVGFIGPNGAGKTTTLKMLSGLLYPTSGTATVDGYVPWERKTAYQQSISMVMGNKGQMAWDIPALDNFYVLGEIYRAPRARLNATLDELVALMDMGDLLTKPVRNLSLGERMKCELVGALLHRPQVLFLDEPTLGLDVLTQIRLRRFIRDYNVHSGATIVLTSHYMADVVELCSRLLVINHGRLIHDGEIDALVGWLAPYRLIRLKLDVVEVNGDLRLPGGAEIVTHEAGDLTLRAERAQVPSIIGHLLASLPVIDLEVKDAPIETVIEQIYSAGVAS